MSDNLLERDFDKVWQSYIKKFPDQEEDIQAKDRIKDWVNRYNEAILKDNKYYLSDDYWNDDCTMMMHAIHKEQNMSNEELELLNNMTVGTITIEDKKVLDFIKKNRE